MKAVYRSRAPLTRWLGDRFSQKPLIIAGAFLWRSLTLLIDERVFMEYWGPMLLFYAEHLSDMLNKPFFGDYSYLHYYRHFHWLMERAKIYAPYDRSGPI
jgi:hypothetical protein